jgi:hypothetical protein
MKDTAKWVNIPIKEMSPEGQKRAKAVLSAMEFLEEYLLKGATEVEFITAEQTMRFSYQKLKREGEIGCLPVVKPKPKEPAKAETAKAKPTKKWF